MKNRKFYEKSAQILNSRIFFLDILEIEIYKTKKNLQVRKIKKIYRDARGEKILNVL